VAVSVVERNSGYGTRCISNACNLFVNSTVVKHLLVRDSKYSDVPLITKTVATRINYPKHISFQNHAEVVPVEPISVLYC
jgi:hypothetical protein